MGSDRATRDACRRGCPGCHAATSIAGTLLEGEDGDVCVVESVDGVRRERDLAIRALASGPVSLGHPSSAIAHAQTAGRSLAPAGRAGRQRGVHLPDRQPLPLAAPRTGPWSQRTGRLPSIARAFLAGPSTSTRWADVLRTRGRKRTANRRSDTPRSSRSISMAFCTYSTPRIGNAHWASTEDRRRPMLHVVGSLTSIRYIPLRASRRGTMAFLLARGRWQGRHEYRETGWAPQS